MDFTGREMKGMLYIEMEGIKTEKKEMINGLYNGFTDKNGCEAISRMDLYSQRCCRAE